MALAGHPHIVLPVRYSTLGTAVQSTTMTISLTGVFVRCLAPPRPGAQVSLRIFFPGSQKPEDTTGVVRETATGPEAGFWADFLSLSPAATMQIESLVARVGGSRPLARVATLTPSPPKPATHDDRRAFPRLDVELKVRFQSASEVVEEYVRNISAGGLFVATGRILARDTIVRVTLELPDGQPAGSAQAVVVHVVSEEQAKKTGTAAGVGVQLLDTEDEFRERLAKYVQSVARSIGD